MEYEKKTTDIQNNIINSNIVEYCLLTIVALFSRMLYCILYNVPNRDSFTYMKTIDEWTTNYPPESLNGVPPLGIYILKQASSILGFGTMKSGYCANIVMSIISVILLTETFKLLCRSRTIGILIGILAATNPTLVENSCSLTRESSYFLFSCMSLFNTIKYIKHRSYYYILCATICISAAYACRHEGIELIIIFFGIILFIPKENFANKTLKTSFALSVFCLMLILLPITIRIPLSFYKTYAERIPLFYHYFK